MKARFYLNSPKCILFGASWSHSKDWSPRLTHIYLGPWLLTITTKGQR